MISLVGYTGFVGSNLAAKGSFDKLYNSKNIAEAFGTNPDVLYYSGVPAQKYIANKFPEDDEKVIQTAFDNIKKINPKKLVLISTVDVYKEPNGKDENSFMDRDNLQPYGLNRLMLEDMVKENFYNFHIVRLPGLYGKNIKKNFIYDFLTFVPAMLNGEKYSQLTQINSEIETFYSLQDNGFYKLKEDADREKAKQAFEKTGFSALNFTDSRGIFQFYNLEYLFNDIQKVIENDIRVMNIATQPVSVSEIYREVTGKEFVNILNKDVYPYYDFRTCYGEIWGKENGYIQDKNFVLEDIKKFIRSYKEV